MKQRSLLILCIAVLLLASCRNKGGKSGLMVPKDAAVVVHINSSSLSSKLSWNEIKQTNWFRELRTHTESKDSLAQKLLDDPSRSGIDTKEDFVMYIRKHGRGSYMVIEGSLTSQAAYEQVLAEMTKKEPKEIKKAGEFSYMVPHGKAVVLWSKSKFALITNANMPGANNMPGRFMKNRQAMPENFEFETDSLVIFGQQALTLEGGQNLDSDSRFADLIKNGSDVHVWYNAEKYFSGMNPLKTLLPMANTDALFKENISAMSLNFDNGKITAKAKHYYSDELSKVIANNRPEPISAEMINRIPSSDVVAVFAFNYSPQGLREILRMLGVEGIADAFLARQNFSIDEFIKANKGGVLIAVSDPKTKMDSVKVGAKTTVHAGMPDANILFATSVKDKTSFDKMITLLWGVSKQMMGREDQGSDKPVIPGINYKLGNDWFAVSNSAEHMDKFLAGGNSNLPFVNKITGHPMGVYVDLQRIIKFTGSMARDSTAGKAIYDASLMMWQDVTAKGGDFKDKTSESEFEINLVDKNTNSLKQLNQYIDKISSAMTQMKKEREGRWKDIMMENRKDSSAMPKTGSPY